jgi:kynurenine 3-monooxygenase
MTEARTSVAIAGAGLAGALLASYLGRRGWRVEVLERRADPRVAGFTGGRSINLALSARGIDALERVGLAERVLAESIPMRGRMLHDARGNLAFQPYSKDRGDAIHSVSRAGLNLALIEAAAAHESVTLRFGQRCLDVAPETPAVRVEDEATGASRDARADVVVGADGAFSAVRARLQRSEGFDYSQSYLEHGYKELTIPPVAGASGSTFAMEPNALHIWPRGGFMMIALPNPDRSFTCTLFWPFRGPGGFESLRTPAEITGYFERVFPDAIPLIPNLVREFQTNPTGALVTVRCQPWHDGGRVVLIGDAAHAIVPFFGQGMNAAFEDCVALDACIGESPGDLARAFAAYTGRRKEHADAIADLAVENFLEMRDKVASRWFRARKRSEHLLHRLFPRWFTPLYHMITFTTIPYADARRRARAQARAIAVIGALAAVAIVVVLAAILLH